MDVSSLVSPALSNYHDFRSVVAQEKEKKKEEDLLTRDS